MFIETKKQLKRIIWLLLVLLIVAIATPHLPKILALRTFILDTICHQAVTGHSFHWEVILFLISILSLFLSVMGVTIKDVKKAKYRKVWLLMLLIALILFSISFFINLRSTQLHDLFQTRLDSIGTCITEEETKDLKFWWSKMTKMSEYREICDKLDRYSKRKNIKLPQ